MAESALDGLKQARARVSDERKNMILRLTNSKGKAQDSIGYIISLQQALDAIDDAIADEEAAQSSVYESRGLAGSDD